MAREEMCFELHSFCEDFRLSHDSCEGREERAGTARFRRFYAVPGPRLCRVAVH